MKNCIGVKFKNFQEFAIQDKISLKPEINLPTETEMMSYSEEEAAAVKTKFIESVVTERAS